MGSAASRREKLIDLLKRLFVLVLAMQDGGVVAARGSEAGGQFEAAFQQVLCVLIALQPRRNFREHADGGDVGGVLFQVLAEERFGFGDVVVVQSYRGLHEVRILRGVADLLGVGRIGACGVAGDGEVVREGAPGVGDFGVEFQRVLERADGGVALPRCAQCEAQFEVSGRPELAARARVGSGRQALR